MIIDISVFTDHRTLEARVRLLGPVIDRFVVIGPKDGILQIEKVEYIPLVEDNVQKSLMALKAEPNDFVILSETGCPEPSLVLCVARNVSIHRAIAFRRAGKNVSAMTTYKWLAVKGYNAILKARDGMDFVICPDAPQTPDPPVNPAKIIEEPIVAIEEPLSDDEEK